MARPKSRPLLWADLEPLLSVIEDRVQGIDEVTYVNFHLKGVSGMLLVTGGVVHINHCQKGVRLQLPAGTPMTQHASHRHYHLGVYTVVDRVAAPTTPTPGLVHVA